MESACRSLMTKPQYVSSIALALTLLAACSSSAQQAQRADPQQMPKGTNTNPDAGMVADFRKRVDDYAKLREKAAGAAPVELQEKSKPADITSAEKSMAQRIREARPAAKAGDIFTPATQAMFRRLLKAPLSKGADAADNKAIIKDDAPAAKEVPFKVNAEYPKDVPLSTVPPDVLLTLPPLPDDIQYRFAGKHLLLFDAKANIIIDYMLNAIP
jgi:hypothetical protein